MGGRDSCTLQSNTISYWISHLNQSSCTHRLNTEECEMGLILSPSAQRGTPLFVSSHRAGLTWVMEKFLCIPRLIRRGDRCRHLLFCLVCFSFLFLCGDNVRQLEKCLFCDFVEVSYSSTSGPAEFLLHLPNRLSP